MQITTLNKVVSLILVGTFVLLLSLCFRFEEIVGYLASEKVKSVTTNTSEAIVVFVITLLLLSLAMCLGLITDAIANLLRGFLKKYLYENEAAVRFLGCAYALENMKYYRTKFNEVFNSDVRYRAIKGSERYNKSYAVAILFHTAKPEHLTWTTEHYSMYVLATDFFAILLICLVAAWFTKYSIAAKSVFSMIDLLILYLLLHSAIDRYLYVYENTYRHVAAYLCGEKSTVMCEVNSGGPQVNKLSLKRSEKSK